IGDAQLACRHLPFVGRRLQQHHARNGAAPADVVLRAAYAAAAAGRHISPGALVRKVATRSDRLDRDLLPIALELLGAQPRQTVVSALPHLRARDADDARIVGLDDDPRVDLGIGCALRGRRCNAEREVETKSQTTACRSCGADNELAAGGILDLVAMSMLHGL